jgi:hypothetical protein
MTEATPSPFRQQAERDLKRLLANGPLTAIPKRPADQELLVALAVAQFEPERVYTETEVNEKLKAWLESFSEPFGIDHVTLRRTLVDSRLMARTTSGSSYRISEKAAAAGELAALDPARILEEIRCERESRKQQHRAD